MTTGNNFNFLPAKKQFNRLKAGLIFSFVAAIFVFAVLAAAAFAYIFIQNKIAEPLSAVSAERTFLIQKGEGVKVVASRLEKQKLILSGFYFEFYVWEKGLAKKLQAGEYVLSPTLSVSQIAEIFVSGQTVPADIEITFPEGFTAKNIAEKLESKKLISVEKFLAGLENLFPEMKLKYDFLAGTKVPPVAPFEGFLFPDTYKFAKDAGVKDILEKFLDNFGEKLTTELRRDISRQNKTIGQIATMASILEKEVRTEEDMGIVSGILWKRIEAGMPLQVDASIVYVTGKKTGEITYGDLKIISPFNTYLNKGLPPAPISNPGVQAIFAAIYPKQSDYWYYLSKPDGTTVFSRNFSEHQRAKQMYLK